LGFLKNIFKMIKGLPGKLKKFQFKDMLAYFKSHRLLSMIYLAVMVLLIVAIILIIGNYRKQETKVAMSQTDEDFATTDIKDLTLIIPENAFPYPKGFTVNNIYRDAAYDKVKALGNFYGEIYELTPTDGRNDLALEPITYTYKIPTEFYFGDEYNNFELLYIEDKENPVVKTFFGGEIVFDKGNQPLLLAKGFHGSLVGLRVNNPEKQNLGIKKIIEKPDTLKPDLLLVPGIDINFQGFLPNTISNQNPQGNNLWEVTFEDRSIWVYDYPLSETRSANYVREAQQFFSDISKTSYVRLEAEKLAKTLLESDQEFDIIAHGIGGIIARYAVENYPVNNIRKMVLISVPNTGTNIVNPSFLNLLYGKDTKVLSQIYGLDTDSIRYLTRNNLGYLENINAFYTDVLPDADVINTLENSIRTDIDYFFLAGSTPDFEVDLEESQFAKFYPENTSGKGDGIVSVYSAIFPSLEESPNEKDHILSKIVPYSFFDIFLQQQTLQYIRTYLEEGIEVIDIPEYEDDTFKEWMFDSPSSTLTESTDQKANDIFSATTTENQLNAESLISTQSTTTLSQDVLNKNHLEDWKSGDVPPEQKTSSQSGISETIKTPTDEKRDLSVESTQVQIVENNIKKTVSIIKDLNDMKGTMEVATTGNTNQTTSKIEKYVPDSSKWNTNLFPTTFANIQNMIVYQLTSHKIPYESSPYGLATVGEMIYLFDKEGVISFKNGIFKRISDTPVSAYYYDRERLYIVQQNIMTEYSEGEPVKMTYLMFEAPVLSLAVTDAHQYYLLNQDGLTFETPLQSYQLDGHYGQIILYGVYPYIITDAGVYLFDGQGCEMIYKPYSSDIQLKSGIVYNDSLYLLASDYSLRAVSLDGKKFLLETANNSGGIKLIHTADKLIIAGRNKFNLIDYSYKKPEGATFDIPKTDKLIDADIFEGNIIVLVREGDSTFIKKLAILE